MNIRDLKYLVAVGRYRHFGKAAKASFVSQPSLSIQIKKLEDELGVQLLERTNKKVVLTQAGHTAINVANKILEQVNSLYELGETLSDPYTGDIKIGMIPTMAPYLLPKILIHLKSLYPKLRILPKESQTHVIIDDLEQGRLDFVILALPIESQHTEQRVLTSEPFYLAVSSHHQYAKRKKATYALLKEAEIMLLEEGHCFRDQALDICRHVGATEHMDMRATSLETLKQMVAINAGITLVPKSAIDRNSSITYIPFASPIPQRTIGMVWRQSAPKKALFDEFAIEISTHLKKEAGP